MHLRSGNDTELIPAAFDVGRRDPCTRKKRSNRGASQAKDVNACKCTSTIEYTNVYTNSSVQRREQGPTNRDRGRGRGRGKGRGQGRPPKGAENGCFITWNKNTMAEVRMQTKQLKVIKVPKFHNWAVKKRRTQFTKYVGMWRRNPSTFSGTYTQLLTYPEPCFLSSQIGHQISDNESKRMCTDAMGSPNTSPKPNTKKRKLDCCFDIPPFYFIQSVDSSPKDVLHQLSRVGDNGRRTLWKEGLELACCSEKLGESQHLFMEPSPEVQLFEPNSNCCKTCANLIDGNITDSAYINNGAAINIATYQSYVDSYRENSPLSYLGSSPANVLPVQETEMFCCSEKIGENQHLVIDVSARSTSFEPNSDWYRSRDNLISENADAASINKERVPVQNSASIVSHMETGPKRLASICDPLAPSTPQNNIQNRPLVGNTVSDPCINKRVEISQGKETNLLSSEISPGAASPSLGGKDAFENRTLHLHPKDGLLADGSNIGRPPKPKRKKHQPKIRKDGIFVKISRLKNQVDSTGYSKQSKKRNSRGDRCQPKASTYKKNDSENFHSQKSNLLQPVMDVSSATNGEIFGSSETSRSRTVACWNDVAIENEYNGLRLQDLNPVLYGKTKKAKLKDLARQKKVTISKSCIENEGTASGLMSQIAPCIDVTTGKKIKGKRTARKRSGSVSRNAENCLCLADSANSGESFIDALNAIQDRFRNLSLNEEQVYSLPERQEMIPLERKDELIPNEESLSLIPYDHNFDSMNIKKIRPRVLLDSETNRVWNLLMGKGEIEDEAEGNEMTERWWKQERHTFKTRAENFIACMRVVQGNRQFSPWKGSVVDSVIGAFLTQNVSDHLSSSAFIALASLFPIDENNIFDTPDPEGMESIVLNNTPYYVSCEVDGQSQEMLRERDDSTESYKSNLSVEDSISYHYQNSVADDRHEVPWPRSPTSDLLTVTDGSNSCEESVHNPISSHVSSFDTNEEQDVMPAHMPFCHFRSCSESNCIAEVQVNESTLKNSCTEHLAETKGEVSLNLQGINRSFESSACHDTVALDDHKDSNGSNTKAKMIKSNMMSNSHDDHNSKNQTTMNLFIGPPQHLESRFPDKTCEILITRHETVSDINLVSLENEPAENEIGFPKLHLQMALCNSQCRADSQPKPNSRTNFEIMKVEECRASNTIQNDHYNSIKQNQFLDGTVELGTESSQNQGSRLDGKTCEQISLQREVQDLTSQIVENTQGENKIGNAIFCGQMAPNYLVLTIQPSKNPLLLQRYEGVPDLTVDFEKNEPAGEELGNAKYHVKMAEDNLELSGEALVQPDRRQNVEIMKLEDEERNVSVGLDKNSSTYTHFEQDHAHSNANTGPPYKDRLGLGSFCQESAVSGECNNFSQKLPYDFLKRSSQERCQANSCSGCQCSSLTEESQVAASALCSLAQQGNSMAFSENLIPLDNRASDELSFELTLSSSPPDALITNNLAAVVPKGHRSTRRSGYVKKNFGKTSGIARGTMEMNQGAFKKKIDWDVINKNAREIYRNGNAKDAVNWEAVRCADIEDIADAIKPRGMNFLLAGRIKVLLNALHKEHGSINLEWLKNMPPEEAKNFLLSIRGLGLKSVECIRLLTLQQMAFPVDTNVGRIVVRLGWVPLEPLPESLQIHLLEKFPLLDKIQKYLWPRLCTLDQRTLYELHYQMITFGKVFCTKSKPNCNACPMKLNCRHFASAYASARLALPAPDTPSEHNNTCALSFDSPQVLAPISSINVLSQQNLCILKPLPMAYIQQQNYEPIVEEPSTPESLDSATHESSDIDYEEMFNVYLSDNSHTLQIYNPSDATHRLASSMALVPVPFEAANIPVPKLKTITRLRTEHRVYEIPDNHQLLDGLEPRLKDDPSSYLLAIWSPGETSEPCCISNGSHEYQCEQQSCRLCTNIRGTNDETVKGTLLIPCRTAMRGRFPLNGTYFQVNEVFADHETSVNPLEVPRAWIWNLQQTTVYFGSSIPSIMRGLSKEEIQKCFWRGYVCVRGFEQKKRAPKRLVPRLHSLLSRKVKDENGHVKYDYESEEI